MSNLVNTSVERREQLYPGLYQFDRKTWNEDKEAQEVVHNQLLG